jgi:hypothetical protein
MSCFSVVAYRVRLDKSKRKQQQRQPAAAPAVPMIVAIPKPVPESEIKYYVMGKMYDQQTKDVREQSHYNEQMEQGASRDYRDWGERQCDKYAFSNNNNYQEGYHNYQDGNDNNYQEGYHNYQDGNDNNYQEGYHNYQDGNDNNYQEGYHAGNDKDYCDTMPNALDYFPDNEQLQERQLHEYYAQMTDLNKQRLT